MEIVLSLTGFYARCSSAPLLGLHALPVMLIVLLVLLHRPTTVKAQKLANNDLLFSGPVSV